jgi:hypothetical protein
MNLEPNRREAQNRALRQLILAGNLMATQLEAFNLHEDTQFIRSLLLTLAAWEQAVENIRDCVEDQP